MVRKIVVGTAIFCGFLALPVTSMASDKELLEPFEKCRSIADDTERLACYDNAVAVAGQLAEQLAEQREERRKEDFGLSDLDIAKRDQEAVDEGQEGVKREPEPKQITATLTDAYQNPRTGKKLFVLDNGQIWRETTSGTMRRLPRNGTTITVEKSSLGGFKLRAEGRRGFAYVKRIK